MELAPQRYHTRSIDGFVPSLPPGVFESRASSDDGWIAICADSHRHLASVRSSAEWLIVEVMLPWATARDDLFRRIPRDGIYYVQLFCELPELERRERQRGDRRAGCDSSGYVIAASSAELIATQLGRTDRGQLGRTDRVT